MDSADRIPRRALTALVLALLSVVTFSVTPAVAAVPVAAVPVAAVPAAAVPAAAVPAAAVPVAAVPAAAPPVAAPPVAAPPADAAPDAFTTVMVDTLARRATTDSHLGTALSGVVVDATDGTVLWRHNATHSRIPASTQKLLTTYTVLTSMDPATTLVTGTCRSQDAPSAVYVRGGGDPSLSRARLRALATATAAGLREAGVTAVSLYLDASFFPAPTAAPGWPASYLKSEVQYVRGLTLAGYRGTDGRVAVGKAFVAELTTLGVVATVAGNAVTPARCDDLASTRSAPVGALVTAMLARSDNDYAEFLLRHAARARGFAPSWRGALDNEIAVLTRSGVPTGGLRVADGSGLSRSNRMPTATLAAVLRLLHDDPALAAVVFAPNALPIAGRTGTLAKRFTTPDEACARGRIQAKTGYLADAVGLAGVAHGADGRDRFFVLIENGSRKYASVRAGIDALATTAVGCALVLP